MKRMDLLKTIECFGYVLIRYGAKHDWYRNPETGVSQPVPRHRKTKERLASRIFTYCKMTITMAIEEVEASAWTQAPRSGTACRRRRLPRWKP